MKYQIECILNGKVLKFRPTDWLSFESDLLSIDRSDSANEYKIIVSGQTVSIEQALDVVKQERTVFEEKRAATKKQVWMRTGGVTNARSNFRQVWVKK